MRECGPPPFWLGWSDQTYGHGLLYPMGTESRSLARRAGGYTGAPSAAPGAPFLRAMSFPVPTQAAVAVGGEP